VLHQKIEPGVTSVVESVGWDLSTFPFPAVLDILPGSWLASGKDKRSLLGILQHHILLLLPELIETFVLID
jgi:hypothetical protein